MLSVRGPKMAGVFRVARHLQQRALLAPACMAAPSARPGMAAAAAAQPPRYQNRRGLAQSHTQLADERCTGANYFADGEDPVLKPDEEYPDWLWELPCTPQKLEDLEEGTQAYWSKQFKDRCIENNISRTLS